MNECEKSNFFNCIGQQQSAVKLGGGLTIIHRRVACECATSILVKACTQPSVHSQTHAVRRLVLGARCVGCGFWLLANILVNTIFSMCYSTCLTFFFCFI